MYPAELKSLKAVIAQDMVDNEINFLGLQPQDGDLEVSERIKSRTLQSLKIAKANVIWSLLLQHFRL